MDVGASFNDFNDVVIADDATESFGGSLVNSTGEAVSGESLSDGRLLRYHASFALLSGGRYWRNYQCMLPRIKFCEKEERHSCRSVEQGLKGTS